MFFVLISIVLLSANAFAASTTHDTNAKAHQKVPVAAFSASPTSGNGPLKVVFTDKSVGKPISWRWNFGDGTSSTTKNPTNIYNKAGKYTVTLTVKNAKGNNKITKYRYITVLAPLRVPVAAFSASPISGHSPLKVVFTDKSTGLPTSWKWNFGDGTSSTVRNPVHTYNKDGKYTVTLTAKNVKGNNKITKYNFITMDSAILVDVVCKMKIDKRTAEFKSEYKGKTYYFCSADCKKKFSEDPEKYISS